MRILIIEDDPAIATNVYDFLPARGHPMDAAGDGLTGLHLAMREPFDVIVLDIGLLAIVRRICEDLGWKIEVQSKPGAGTTFSVVFS